MKSHVPLSQKWKSKVNQRRVKHLSILMEIRRATLLHSEGFSANLLLPLRALTSVKRNHLQFSVNRCFCLSSSTGMDSNSQTSQELLIPNDVRRRNCTLRRANPLVLLVFSQVNNRKRENRNSVCVSHAHSAEEQVTAAGSVGAAAAIIRVILTQD